MTFAFVTANTGNGAVHNNIFRGGEMSAHSIQYPLTRTVLWLGFFGLVLLSWYGLYDMARGDGFLCGPEEIRLIPLGGFWVLFPMWAVMMVAMMLPTLVPVLHSYDRLPAGAGAGGAGWVGLVLGYLTIWILGSAGFATVQVFALHQNFVDLTGVLTWPWAAPLLLGLAGVWQFTRLKTACQDACLSPMQYFIGRWKPGFSGGVSMGVDIGLTCVGCCWAIMALAFIGGPMNLFWMGLATLFMVAEKLPDLGMHLRRPAGLALIGASLFAALGNLELL